MKTYTYIVEKCPDTGYYVGYVPGFPGAHSQGETLDELHKNMQEVVGMLTEDGEPELEASSVRKIFQSTLTIITLQRLFDPATRAN
jgi:predicted RNase H-like HicB family nuclease